MGMETKKSDEKIRAFENQRVMVSAA